MAYSQGGLIAASDYNTFVGTDPSSTANALNTVWATGNGQYGYGQSAISQIATGNTVTAAQWSALINALNSTYTHQLNSGTGISAVTAGSTIAYLSALSGDLSTAYSNHLAFATQGGTTGGTTYSPNLTVGNTTAAEALAFTRTITFGSADQARYFFNAGGQINFVTISATANDGSGRSSDLATLVGTYLGSINAIRATSNGGRTGSGGTVNTNNTGLGYYSSTTGAQNIAYINSTGYTYTGDYVTVAIRTNGTQGSNADNGSVVYLDAYLYSGGRTGGELWNQTLNVTWNHRIDIVYPESTNLSSSWGTPVVS
jgi:hypothetical protein